MTRSDESAADPAAGAPDIVAETQAEVAHELGADRPRTGGAAYQVVGALVILVVGLGGAILAYTYGLGTLRRPGAGLWPFVVSVVIVLLAITLLAAGRRLTDSEAFSRSSILPVVGILTVVGLGALMPLVGFEIPSLVLCMIWLRFLGGETWLSTVVTSIITVAAFYALFLYGLSIPLPHLFSF